MLAILARCYAIARNVVDSWVLKANSRHTFYDSQRMNKPKVLVTRGDILKSAIRILEEKYTYIGIVVVYFTFFVLFNFLLGVK
jgi:hypothetical protein